MSGYLTIRSSVTEKLGIQPQDAKQPFTENKASLRQKCKQIQKDQKFLSLFNDTSSVT